jgi:AbrB family looped-hinge helix DNA binding protein
MPLTARIGKRGQMTLPRDVRARYGLEEGQSVAFVVKNGELTLVPLRKTIFDFKGAVQPKETSDLAEIRERVAAEQSERVARGE